MPTQDCRRSLLVFAAGAFEIEVHGPIRLLEIHRCDTPWDHPPIIIASPSATLSTDDLRPGGGRLAGKWSDEEWALAAVLWAKLQSDGQRHLPSRLQKLLGSTTSRTGASWSYRMGNILYVVTDGAEGFSGVDVDYARGWLTAYEQDPDRVRALASTALFKTEQTSGLADELGLDAKAAIIRETVESNGTLAEPFSEIFVDWEEAWWAFDLIRETLSMVGVENGDDPLVAVTLPKGANKLHVDYGQWLLLGFSSGTDRDDRVSLPLLRNRQALQDARVTGEFTGQAGRPPVDLCGLTIETVRQASDAERAEMARSFEEGRARFSGWSSTPYRISHIRVLGEAVFDESTRRRLLSHGLSDFNQWDAYVGWAGIVLADPAFLANNELGYKHRIAKLMQGARTALLQGDDTWHTGLTTALKDRELNFVSFYAKDTVRKWAAESPEELASVIRPLWTGANPGAPEFLAYFDAIPKERRQARSNPLLSLLLMGLDERVYPPYRAASFSLGYDLTEFDDPDAGSDYNKALRFLDRLISESALRGIEVSDRLIAQSLVFCIEQISHDWHPESMSPTDVQKLIDYREGNMVGSIYDHVRDRRFAFPDWVITDYALALATKPFVILSGISGTGKTKIAQFLAEYAAPNEAVEVSISREPELAEGQFVHKVGLSTLKHRALTIPQSAVSLLPALPERGGGLSIAMIMPDGQHYQARMNNIGFSDMRSTGVSVGWRADMSAQLNAIAQIGDYLVCTPGGTEGDIWIEVERVAAAKQVETRPSRQRAFMSVRADWTDNRQLLGYFNPLLGEYVPTELLKLLLRARTDRQRPYFVILDEMNLAKVEYYFSDFLSAMEGDEVMILHDAGSEIQFSDDDGEVYEIPERLAVPPNVFFTGTVNVDETTYMFSPKVLDRANVIEFNDVDLLVYSDETDYVPSWRLTANDVEGLIGLLMRHVPSDGDDSPRNPMPEDWLKLPPELREPIQELNVLLQKHHLHFGYRVANEIARFLNLAEENTKDQQPSEALDLQILQKVLPKLNGSRARLREPLQELLKFTNEHHFERSGEKISRMLKTVQEVGFVSFVE